MKILAALLLLLAITLQVALADTPPPGTVKIKDSSGADINSAGGSLEVKVTSAATPVSPAGSHVTNTSVGSGSAVSFVAPAHAVGFILEASSSNSVNLRWAVGATATTSVGMRLEPGRDSSFIPVAANVSVIAESGSGQEAEIQWILSQ